MRDVIIKAAKTFVQAAVGYVCTLNLTGTDWGNKTVVIGIILAAVSAGLSALMNIDWDALTAGKANSTDSKGPDEEAKG